MAPDHSWMEEIHAIVAALAGGARYGFKIRVPHALVMTMLFRRDLPASEKIRSVVRLALEHATKLAAFATIYKTILALFKRGSRYLRRHELDGKTIGRTLLAMIVDGPTHHLPASLAAVGHPDRTYHSFVAGWIGGYCVWGDYSSINNQVLLYLISRIQVGLIKKVWEALHGTSHSHPESALQHPYLYPMIAASAWGVVMALFEESPHVLHPSLRSSMDEIYRYQLSFGSSFGDTTEAATSGT